MKLNFPVLLFALLVLANCFLCRPGIGQEDYWSPPPLDQIQQSRPAGGSGSAPGSPSLGPLSSTLKIVSPAANAVLRGIVEIKVEGLEKGGFAVFRLDDEFAYATVYPYKMRWDTQGAQDGRHIVRVNGYSRNGRVSGVTSLTVNVKNSIASPGGEGVSLELRPQSGLTITREIEAVSSVAGLGGDTVLPDNLLALQSRLFARIGQSVAAMTPSGLVDIRSTIRQGAISTDKKELPFKEKGYYGIFTQTGTGLATPPSSDSRRPRIGLTEISLEVPRGKVREGTSWVAPMRIVPDLVKRDSVQVMGTHTFEGLWWMQNRKCARISSTYQVNEIALTENVAGQGELLEDLAEEPALPQLESPGLFSALPGMMTGEDLTAGMEAPVSTIPAEVTSTEIKVTRLTGLSGTRTTWIDIEQGIVVRTEDDLAGTFVFGSNAPAATANAGETSSSFLQRLPYNLSLTEELVK